MTAEKPRNMPRAVDAAIWLMRIEKKKMKASGASITTYLSGLA